MVAVARADVRRAKATAKQLAAAAVAKLPATATTRQTQLARDAGGDEVRRLSADLAAAELKAQKRRGKQRDRTIAPLGRDRDGSCYWHLSDGMHGSTAREEGHIRGEEGGEDTSGEGGGGGGGGAGGSESGGGEGGSGVGGDAD